MTSIRVSIHPFNELMPVVTAVIKDGILTEEEQLDLVWLCKNLRSTDYYDQTTADIQQLHGILGGIIADGIITEAEMTGLSDWLQVHDHLRTCWPYDEVDSLITSVMADRKIDAEEHTRLHTFFEEFLALGSHQSIARRTAARLGDEPVAIRGLCAISPQIVFADSTFCFTGASKNFRRAQFKEIITQLGGRAQDTIHRKLNYLVIGAEGNPSWAYACYGRKVEEAILLRQQGSRLLLVHEFDFRDALADVGQ